ncbi:uncharacterized protein MYCFIDRAFT_40224 [Pseudocercospora fijiensis CIRAD86]|uniref:Uncharacterized protein n=1 Tax=Pseudocercospora fijiensis (strain CIRAD86) TaxID=383855 RepID=M3AZ22_PSEFD|nr:uncharacterized protein MYCFIDRAFT_40224 [Pseudocercospora fijiensis CIRAD86]EME82433.1 hypothetical protein MYCFIDRAFT_40224 [Pseudocercospora fijiensis CIRAD86]
MFGVDPRLAANDTALFCEATYYQQEVHATIALPSKAVISTSPAGEKIPLPSDMFNISSFEWAMASGMEQVPTRGEYPTSSFPSQKSRLLDMPLNLDYIPKMAPFAIATLPRPAEDYLAPDVLRRSYESAYRLLFSRQLVDILQDRHDQATAPPGRLEFITQAVVIIPAFAYAALVLLGLISMTTFGVLLGISRRPNQLLSDPATLGSLMDLVSADQNTSDAFATVDSEPSDGLRDKMKDQEFALLPVADADHPVVKIRHCAPPNLYADSADTAQRTDKEQCKAGIRPLEMKVIIGSMFLFVQLSAVVTFVVLYILSHNSSGLKLPSESTFVRQLVENYIPIALATLIEPFWIVLNRLLSLLQPFEELRKANVPASRSIEVDYSSLPPQLLLVRAFSARHYVLGTVCMMALLANVLAVALSGLMNERTMIVASESQLQTSYDSVLLSSINGTGTPLNGVLDDNSDGSMTVDPFYRKMSNLTAETPLPAWADDERAYLPARLSALNQSSNFRLTTPGFGAQLNCQVLTTEGVPRYNMKYSDDASELDLETTLVNDSGAVVNCSNYRNWGRAFSTFNLNTLRDPQPGHMALELNSMLTSRNTTTEHDLFCRQNLVAGWLRADWRLKSGETMPGSSLAAWPKMDLLSLNATMLLCRPTLVASKAKIRVDSSGRVLEATPEGMTSPGDVTVPSVLGLLAQANRYLIDSGATWHNDSFPSDYNNYLMVKQFPNAKESLNASLPIPTPSQVVGNFAKVYQQLFAIFIATNFQNIFTPNSGKVAPISTQVLTPETRIVFSTPAFIIVQTILGLYMITTIWFYARRPWRVLPRLPSTIASNIAYFAASRALVDLSRRNAEDAKDLRQSWTWSYGTFLGVDGKAHVGIERDPYVLAPDEDGLSSYSEEGLGIFPPGRDIGVS